MASKGSQGPGSRRSSQTTGPPQTRSSVANGPPQSTGPSQSSIGIPVHFQSPMVLTPVSQLNSTPRKFQRPRNEQGDRPTSFDPKDYNADGTLRTMHCLPGFDQTYAQARQARYIRAPQAQEHERELSIKQIFDRK